MQWEKVKYTEALLRPEVRVEMADPEIQVQEGDNEAIKASGGLRRKTVDQ